MSKSSSLKDVSRHFAFGENWASYATMIDESRIKSAETGLVRLLGDGALAGKSFLVRILHAFSDGRLQFFRNASFCVDVVWSKN